MVLLLLLVQVEMAMRASMSILQGSFDPIMDAANNTDLLPLIIQAKVSAVVEAHARCCGVCACCMCWPLARTATLQYWTLARWSYYHVYCSRLGGFHPCR
jgi:hypothetical protein